MMIPPLPQATHRLAVDAERVGYLVSAMLANDWGECNMNGSTAA